MGEETTLALVTNLVHLALIEAYEELDGVAALSGLLSSTVGMLEVAAPVPAQGHFQELHGVFLTKFLEQLCLCFCFHGSPGSMPLSRPYAIAAGGCPPESCCKTLFKVETVGPGV
jgi:hypothetical protein